jgi:hypothetical protein
MAKSIFIRLVPILFIAMVGCRLKTVVPESYQVIASPTPLTAPYTSGTPIHLTAGEKQKVSITIRHLRSEKPTAKLQIKYQVQFSAPADLLVSPTYQDVEYTLETDYFGFNYSLPMSVEVVPEAAPGEREVKVTIRPVSGPTTSATVPFYVVKKGS